MGNYQTKENVAVAQAQVSSGTPGELNQRINTMSLVLIVLVIVVIGAIFYGIRLQCHRRARNWLRKEIVAANVNQPVVRVQTVQQQPAAATTTHAGYV